MANKKVFFKLGIYPNRRFASMLAIDSVVFMSQVEEIGKHNLLLDIIYYHFVERDNEDYQKQLEKLRNYLLEKGLAIIPDKEVDESDVLMLGVGGLKMRQVRECFPEKMDAERYISKVLSKSNDEDRDSSGFAKVLRPGKNNKF